MTVTASESFNTYVGNGVTTLFEFTFKIFDEGDLEVRLSGAVVPSSEYTIQNITNDGGQVVFNVAPAGGVVIGLIRNMTVDQLTEFKVFGAFPSDDTEDAMDKLIMLKQGLIGQDLGGMNLGLAFVFDGINLLCSKGTDAFIPIWDTTTATLSGVYSGEQTENAPADGAATSKALGYVWKETGLGIPEVPPPPPPPAFDLSTALFNWWEMDETGDGAVRRVSVMNHFRWEWEMRNQDGEVGVAGLLNGAMRVDSASTNFNLGFELILDDVYDTPGGRTNAFTRFAKGDFTWWCWFKPTVDVDGTLMSVGKDHVVQVDGSGWELRVNSVNNRVEFLMYNLAGSALVASTGNYIFDDWNLVVVRWTHDTNEMAVSLNGADFDTLTSGINMRSQPPANVIFEVMIGVRIVDDNFAVDNKFQGHVDQNGLFYRALAQDDVTEGLFNAGAGRTFDSVNTPPYADLATAEASGDTWASRSLVVADGVGYVYDLEMRVEGHSGLVHNIPFSDHRVVGDVLSLPSGSGDPDDFVGTWLNAATGVQGVDYDYQEVAGKSRYINLTSSGRAALYTPIPPDTYDLGIFVFGGMSVTWTGNPVTTTQLRLNVSADSPNIGNTDRFDIGIIPVQTSVLWHYVGNGGTQWLQPDVFVNPAVPTRQWLYVDRVENDVAWWIDSGLVHNSNLPLSYPDHTSTARTLMINESYGFDTILDMDYIVRGAAAVG